MEVTDFLKGRKIVDSGGGFPDWKKSPGWLSFEATFWLELDDGSTVLLTGGSSSGYPLLDIEVYNSDRELIIEDQQ